MMEEYYFEGMKLGGREEAAKRLYEIVRDRHMIPESESFEEWKEGVLRYARAHDPFWKCSGLFIDELAENGVVEKRSEDKK
jgi:hypothetical protein